MESKWLNPGPKWCYVIGFLVGLVGVAFLVYFIFDTRAIWALISGFILCLLGPGYSILFSKEK